MMQPHDDAMLELAAARAVGALDAGEAATIDRHMAECDECREEFARASAAVVAIASSVARPAPAAVRDRVLRSAVSVRRIRPWYEHPAFGASLIAAAIIIVSGAWFINHRSPSERRWAASCAGVATATCGGEVVETAGLFRLTSHGLPKLPAGKVYQVWVIHGKNAPIPEPTFTTDQHGDGASDIPSFPAAGDVIAVTVEPEGGSKAPTTKPVLVSTLD